MNEQADGVEGTKRVTVRVTKITNESLNNTSSRALPTPETAASRTLRIQNERKGRIAEVCSQRTSLLQRPRFPHRIPWKLNKKDKYLYCPIPKAGWSSWKRLWFYTSGLINSTDTDVGIRDDDVAHVDDIKNEYEGIAAMKSGRYNFSFTFVSYNSMFFCRDPWERLVSAYINKAVEYNYSRELHTPCSWESLEPYKPDLTFEQFLTCINGGSQDMHWFPQSSLCNVCRVKFDFIGHLETVQEDAEFVIKHLGLNGTYPHSFASKKYSTKEVMEEWYQSIPATLLKSLARLYELDFMLHGYNPKPPGRNDI
ncbi:carbohydrate sulfotransferase 14-like [Watersipora subatra]|uniref:carbohydrate sulfotransferase 14-like n=1 Tax=Watersipora subatra TaxID=2589382 RepID=UPI00355BC1E3